MFLLSLHKEGSAIMGIDDGGGGCVKDTVMLKNP